MTQISIIKAREGFLHFILFSDLYSGLQRTSLWSAFAWDEIQRRYRRSKLGLVWIGLSYLIFVAAIALFFGAFSGMSGSNFTVHVAYNYAAFTFLVANISDGCDVFKVSKPWIKSSTLPHSVFVLKSIARSAFTFAITMIVAFGVAVFFENPPKLMALWAIPAVLLYLLNAVWIQFVFGYIATRYRDVPHLVAAITRLLFFLTPIIWVLEERKGLTRTIAEFNPLTHALEIFSAPLLGRAPDMTSWYIAIAVTVVGWIVATIVSATAYRRLAYWL